MKSLSVAAEGGRYPGGEKEEEEQGNEAGVGAAAEVGAGAGARVYRYSYSSAHGAYRGTSPVSEAASLPRWLRPRARSTAAPLLSSESGAEVETGVEADATSWSANRASSDVQVPEVGDSFALIQEFYP
jgi:hypothetical protein